MSISKLKSAAKPFVMVAGFGGFLGGCGTAPIDHVDPAAMSASILSDSRNGKGLNTNDLAGARVDIDATCVPEEKGMLWWKKTVQNCSGTHYHISGQVIRRSDTFNAASTASPASQSFVATAPADVSQFPAPRAN